MLSSTPNVKHLVRPNSTGQHSPGQVIKIVK